MLSWYIQVLESSYVAMMVTMVIVRGCCWHSMCLFQSNFKLQFDVLFLQNLINCFILNQTNTNYFYDMLQYCGSSDILGLQVIKYAFLIKEIYVIMSSDAFVFYSIHTNLSVYLSMWDHGKYFIVRMNVGTWLWSLE